MVAWMCGNSAWRHHFGFAKVALYAWADGKTLRQKLKFNLVHQFCENRVKILDSSMQTKCLVKFFSWSKIPLMPCEDIVMKKENGTIMWPSILPKYVPFRTTFYCENTFVHDCKINWPQKLVPVRQLHQLVSKAPCLNYHLCLSTLFYISLT